MTDPIRLVREGAVARLVLDRPDKRNALDLAMWRAIPPALAPLAADASVRLLVIEGAGAHFAAGADIAEFEAAYGTREDALANHRMMMAAMTAIEAFPAPTVAAIRGACVGGGMGLALCADLRFAEHGARFGITPAKLGLSYGLADTRRLVAAVGVSAAKDILFTGRLMGADEALALRLIDRLGPDVGALVAAFADELQAASAASARAIKQVFRMLRDGAVDDTEASRALFANAFAGPDFREGMTAFLEKRSPKFS
ncbi:MAG: enoyl-CoA hydratase/isomerase family protein [Alphaproteobacteria bacterium]|nr:enoyl-CoA hydratase/isomerase family protein [Alphaproteobacteria bacterium]